MAKFKVGDKVRVRENSFSGFKPDAEGEIFKIGGWSDSGPDTYEGEQLYLIDAHGRDGRPLRQAVMESYISLIQEDSVTEFKVGQKVKIKGTDVEGTVSYVFSSGDLVEVGRGSGRTALRVPPEALEAVEEPKALPLDLALNSGTELSLQRSRYLEGGLYIRLVDAADFVGGHIAKEDLPKIRAALDELLGKTDGEPRFVKDRDGDVWERNSHGRYRIAQNGMGEDVRDRAFDHEDLGETLEFIKEHYSPVHILEAL